MNRCLICGSNELHIFTGYTNLHGLTSDCKPWPRAGEFIVCMNCGLAQKRLSRQWFADINQIYSNYEMYPLSGGEEPLIFDQDGSPAPRSRVLLEGILPQLNLPVQGSILDVGCGNGSLLSQFNRLYPEWESYGHEQAGRKEDILSISGVQGFFSGDLSKIDRSFDLVTMTYVIEHLTEPVKVLRRLSALLHSGGYVIIHTSAYESNPFDLMVCDHCSHFTPATLSRLAMEAGLEQVMTTDSILEKEIGIILRKGSPQPVENNQQYSKESLESSLRWLERLLEKARSIPTEKKVGIFGTAVAGTWLAGDARCRASFFVDEDPSKHGQKHMGLPVITPEEVPGESVVIMGFNAALGRRIAKRINSEYPRISFIIPDDVSENNRP